MTQRPHNERNAGRKPWKTEDEKFKVKITVAMTSEMREKFKQLGGSEWVRQKIEEA